VSSLNCGSVFHLKIIISNMDFKDLDIYELLGVLSTANIQEVSE
jgi:hypothetical protein